MRPPLQLKNWLEVYPLLMKGTPAVVVDKTQLINLINAWDESVDDYPPEDYTHESYQLVLDTYAIAVAVRDNPDATQEEVDTAYLNLLNAIAGLEEVPSGDECTYPLDKTDFSDIAAALGAPEDFISRPEPLDSSQQYFKVTDGVFNVLAPKELIMDSYSGLETTSPIVGNINAGFSFGIEFDFSEKTEGVTPENIVAILLPFKDGDPLFTGSEFNQNYAVIAGSTFHPESNKYTVVAVVTSDGFFASAFESDGTVVGSNYVVSPAGEIDVYDDFGIMFQIMLYDEEENPEGSVFEGTRIRLISDKEELSNLINKVDYSEVPDVITTLCGQPLDLSPIEPEECVYPLDVTQEQLDLLGVTTFDVLDPCYNKFTNPAYKHYDQPYSWAMRKEYFDALMIGADVPSEYLIPRGRAFEIVFTWDREGKPDGNIGVIELFGDGTLMGGAIRVRSSLKDSEVAAEIQQIDGSFNDLVPQTEFELLRFGILYEEGKLTVKSNIANDEVFAVDWEYLSMYISQNTPALKMTFDFITRAKDLTFSYPEGTRGLDGELIGG